LATLAQIIAAYKRDHQTNAARELRWFANQPSLRDAVGVAALAQMPGGKRFSHQRRIPGAVLAEAKRILLANIARLASATSFEQLRAEIERVTGPIHGIGELYVYDTSFRIAAHRGLKPAHVYIHAGVRTGAKNLGLDPGAGSVAIDALPKPLRDLEAYEIEDILCIYKNQLAGAAMADRQLADCHGAEKPRRKIIC
jgi:hypothetical protein